MGDQADRAAKVAEARAGVKKSPAWAKLVAVISIVLMGAGVALPLVVSKSGSSSPGAPGHSAMTGAAGLTGDTGGGGSAESADSSPAAAWGPWVFRMGFSFFVAFVIAYALRSFFRIALFALGFFFIALFGLQYAGLIKVDWTAMETRYEGVSEGVESGARSAMTYIKTYLPSAAAAGVGFVAGWLRRGV
jgi:uncharacterized membrane protein (Fun14 family)